MVSSEMKISGFRMGLLWWCGGGIILFVVVLIVVLLFFVFCIVVVNFFKKDGLIILLFLGLDLDDNRDDGSFLDGEDGLFDSLQGKVEDVFFEWDEFSDF